MSTRIIYEDDHIQILFEPGDDHFLLVTFGTKNELANGKSFWAKSVMEKARISGLGIMPKGANWYPKDSMIAASQEIKKIRDNYSRVVLYGQSMGAYAAAKYGYAFSADLSLAFSPQYSIDPNDLSGADRRFISHFRADMHGNMAISREDIAKRLLVVYDPYDKEDGFNVAKIWKATRGPRVSCISVPFMAHFPIGLVRGTSSILELITAGFNGDVSKCAKICRRGRRKSHQRIARVLARYIVRRPSKLRSGCESFFARCGDASPAIITEFVTTVGKFALNKGNIVDAKWILGKSEKVLAANLSILRLRADVNVAADEIGPAIDTAREMTRLAPRTSASWNFLGGLLVRTGEVEAAKDAYDAALAIDPHNSDVMRRLSGLLGRAGDEDGALSWARRAVDARPGDPHCYAHLSGTLLAFGHVKEACSAAETAVSLAPEDEGFAARLERARARAAAMS